MTRKRLFGVESLFLIQMYYEHDILISNNSYRLIPSLTATTAHYSVFQVGLYICVPKTISQHQVACGPVRSFQMACLKHFTNL